MSIFEKKEKNLNELINKLDVLTSTYSQSSYETEKIKTEKNEILRQKSGIYSQLWTNEIYFFAYCMNQLIMIYSEE